MVWPRYRGLTYRFRELAHGNDATNFDMDVDFSLNHQALTLQENLLFGTFAVDTHYYTTVKFPKCEKNSSLVETWKIISNRPDQPTLPCLYNEDAAN